MLCCRVRSLLAIRTPNSSKKGVGLRAHPEKVAISQAGKLRPSGEVTGPDSPPSVLKKGVTKPHFEVGWGICPLSAVAEGRWARNHPVRPQFLPCEVGTTILSSRGCFKFKRDSVLLSAVTTGKSFPTLSLSTRNC